MILSDDDLSSVYIILLSLFHDIDMFIDIVIKAIYFIIIITTVGRLIFL